jgi:hypothetical protein
VAMGSTNVIVARRARPSRVSSAGRSAIRLRPHRNSRVERLSDTMGCYLLFL